MFRRDEKGKPYMIKGERFLRVKVGSLLLTGFPIEVEGAQQVACDQLGDGIVVSGPPVASTFEALEKAVFQYITGRVESSPDPERELKEMADEVAGRGTKMNTLLQKWGVGG